MNKKDYKRLKAINGEIAQLNQDVENILSEIRESYIKRDLRDVKTLEKNLSRTLRLLNLRETIREELMLPKYVKLENAYQDIKDFCEENENIPLHKGLIEEYISINLIDTYNHCHYDFTWVVKDKDIYVTNIRWNKNQILPNDLKMVLKGKKRIIKNDLVEVTKHMMFEGTLAIKHKGSNYFQGATLKKAIRILEDHYYM